MGEQIRKVVIGDCTLYCGDSLEVPRDIDQAEAIITDPIWPNAPDGMFAEQWDRGELLEAVLAHCHGAERVAVILRCDSDPRFLSHVPKHWPFFRVCWLRYALPSYYGRTLGGMEVAYIFGRPIRSSKGRHLIPGMSPVSPPNEERFNGHPCPRALSHLKWLVHWHSDQGETVLDPFMGSGTTGVACALLGRKFIGVEIEPSYFDIACRRVEEAYRQGDLLR